jgi:hypothetical protein
LEKSGSHGRKLMTFLRNRRVQIFALVIFLGGIGVYSLQKKYIVTDFDTWWHLKVGDWIIQNSAVPHMGILSRTAANRPWVAYSWGYEVLLSLAYAWLGLVGIGIYGAALTVVVAFSTYWMVRHLSGRFWMSALLAGITGAAFLFNGAPRPVFFSYILFCALLTVLFESERTGHVRLLYWLPLLFVFWANLHIQFIYGLFTLCLFAGIHVLQQIFAKLKFQPGYLTDSKLPWKPLVLVLAGCAAVTLVGPNLYHPYLAVLSYAKAKFTYKVIVELQPLPFRIFSNFIELFLAAAGFYAVGWQKKISPFKLALLAIASVVAFRTMRDAWFICLSAAACVADFPVDETAAYRKDSWRELAVTAAAVIFLISASAPLIGFTPRALDRAISADYPVDAINFLRRNSFPGPLYNNLNWGGFLMWYLPELPVAVDGRNDLYGDELDQVFYYSESAFPSYKTDPYLNESGLVVLQSTVPLATVLTIDPRFRLIYRDQVATVFARK